MSSLRLDHRQNGISRIVYVDGDLEISVPLVDNFSEGEQRSFFPDNLDVLTGRAYMTQRKTATGEKIGQCYMNSRVALRLIHDHTGWHEDNNLVSRVTVPTEHGAGEEEVVVTNKS